MNNNDLEHVKINKNISNDLNTLKKHYSILLNYVSVLEKKLYDRNNEIAKLNRIINYYKEKVGDLL